MSHAVRAGDTVLFEMPKDWHPELGIRTYPAIVLYRTGPSSKGTCVDVQVFTGIVGDELLRYSWVEPGDAPGQWRPCGSKQTGP